MAAEKFSDYYYGDESTQFSFYRIPQKLITGKHFKHISIEAKLLYGLLLDRMGLSAKSGWHDQHLFWLHTKYQCRRLSFKTSLRHSSNRPINQKF